MTRVQRQAAETWADMIDRDFHALINGQEPLNDDLKPLSGFLTNLVDFSSAPLDPEFVDTQAEITGAVIRARRAATSIPISPKNEDVHLPWTTRLRNRATAAATSLLVVGGMTGVAWAADGAAPGDFLYGIDTALEAVGIGAGGAEERLAEIASAANDAELEQGESQGLPRSPDRADRRSQIGSENVPAGAVALHDYLASISTTDGLSIAEIARHVAEMNQQDSGKPDDVGRPDHVGRLDDVGKPEHTGKP